MPPRVLKSVTCGEEGCRKENLPRMICKESPNVNNIGMAYYVCRGTVNVPHPSWFRWEADLNLEVIVPVDQGDLVTSGNSRDPPPPPPTQPVSQAARDHGSGHALLCSLDPSCKVTRISDRCKNQRGPACAVHCRGTGGCSAHPLQGRGRRAAPVCQPPPPSLQPSTVPASASASQPSATQASSTLPPSHQSDSQQPFDPAPRFFTQLRPEAAYAMDENLRVIQQQQVADKVRKEAEKHVGSKVLVRAWSKEGTATKPVTRALQVATYPIIKIDAALLESVGLVGAADFHYWDWDNREWIKGSPDLWLELSPPGDRDLLLRCLKKRSKDCLDLQASMEKVLQRQSASTNLSIRNNLPQERRMVADATFRRKQVVTHEYIDIDTDGHSRTIELDDEAPSPPRVPLPTSQSSKSSVSSLASRSSSRFSVPRTPTPLFSPPSKRKQIQASLSPSPKRSSRQAPPKPARVTKPKDRHPPTTKKFPSSFSFSEVVEILVATKDLSRPDREEEFKTVHSIAYKDSTYNEALQRWKKAPEGVLDRFRGEQGDLPWKSFQTLVPLPRREKKTAAQQQRRLAMSGLTASAKPSARGKAKSKFEFSGSEDEGEIINVDVSGDEDGTEPWVF
ncbi:hypothetical protein BKA70DRAFT_1569446 [Coprinopsis sp. MPI-PUGE-AT-0042]|nr:hypothetical protein BKA70DRAFT_1569446 [Coprinopsis sp. MPI-PUGE-AT-0042]